MKMALLFPKKTRPPHSEPLVFGVEFTPPPPPIQSFSPLALSLPPPPPPPPSPPEPGFSFGLQSRFCKAINSAFAFDCMNKQETLHCTVL